MRTNRLLLPAALLALALAGPAQAASISAAPDRFVVPAGETFDLIISLTDGDSWEPPDVSALTRDFEIVDRRRASHAEMVNGKPVHVDQWVMTLLPRRTGTLTIPSLMLGGLASPTSQVQVTPASPGSAQADEGDLFVRVEAASTAPAYVQSDVPVTVRIFDAVGMRSGSMEKPIADGATFTEDGGQRSYVRTIGKRRYRVIEQSYLMRPQKSGAITIPPITLNASLPGFPGSGAGSDLSSLLGRSGMGGPPQRTVSVKSRPVTVNVLSRPEGVTGWFLPARGVTLSQEWSAPLDKVKVGDTLTRTLTLTAKAAGPNQLPPLESVPVDGLRQYVESSTTDATMVDGAAGAFLTRRISLVPTRPGPVTLPAIEVPWWNLATNKQEVAVLPAVTIDVQPGADMPAAPVAPAAVERSAAVSPPPASALDTAPAEGFSLAMLAGYWRSALLVALGLVGLGLLVVAGMRHRAGVAKATTPLQPGSVGPRRRRRITARGAAQDRAQLLATLRTACRKNAARTAHEAYVDLVRMGAFAAPSPELQRAADDLARHLYGDAGRRWVGKPLLTALERAERHAARAARRPSGARLAPLYPGGR